VLAVWEHKAWVPRSHASHKSHRPASFLPSSNQNNHTGPRYAAVAQSQAAPGGPGGFGGGPGAVINGGLGMGGPGGMRGMMPPGGNTLGSPPGMFFCCHHSIVFGLGSTPKEV
jgi:hypothetical protein